MANINRPSGLIPVDNMAGIAWNGKANLYRIPASYGTAPYIRQPVTLAGTATAVTGIPEIKILTGGDGAAITGQTAANIPVGVIVGLGKYEGLIANPSNLDITYRPASDPAIWYAMVVDDPNTLFEVQDIGASTALTYTDVGSNINLTAGSGATYISSWGLDNGSKGTTYSFQMKLLRLVRRNDNVVGQYSKWVCKWNVHTYMMYSLGL